ncbi:MAG: hypothetical protein V4598_13415 [Bdellovibrionota bacterium]
MRKSKLFVLLILAACASSKNVTGPDGTPHKLITCSQLGKCFEKAAEVCEGSFKQVETKVETIPGYNGTTTEEVKILVKCEKT